MARLFAEGPQPARRGLALGTDSHVRHRRTRPARPADDHGAMPWLHPLPALLLATSGLALAQPVTQAPAPGPRWQWATSFGAHHYREPVADMELQGPEWGAHLRLSEFPAWPRWQVDADVLASAQRYDSPDGVLERVANVESRWRLLYQAWPGEAGHGLFLGPAVQTVYNDLRGRTSRNFAGYERRNLSLWLALQWRSPLAWQALPALAGLQLDAGRLVRGRQVSQLSQVDPRLSDLVHTQRHGRYLEARLNLRAQPLVLQPFVRHTVVKDSAVSQGFYEPENHRWQLGLSVRWPAR